MSGPAWWQWVLAFAGAIVVHAALAAGLKPLVPGVATPPAGTSVSVSGNVASVLGGSIEAQPVRASRAKTRAATAQAVRTRAVEARAVSADRVAPVPASGRAPSTAPATAVPASPVQAGRVAALRVVPVPTVGAPAVPAAQVPKPVSAQPVDPLPVDRPAPSKAEPAKPQTTPGPVGARAEPKARVAPPPRKKVRRAKTKKDNAQSARSSRAQRRGSRKQGAAGTTKGGRGQSTVSAGVMRVYGMRVHQRIKRQSVGASGRGRTLVVLRVAQSGRLLFARVSRSSGQGYLDRAAIAAVRRASPFPRPPPGATARQLTFVVPFIFR